MYYTNNNRSNEMQYLEMFDEDFIDQVDGWIQTNDADINEVKAVSFSKIKKELKEEYAGDN